MASSRTAAYEPAKPMPAMITAPVTTTPMRIRCIRVSCSGAATRTPLPLRVVARNRVAHVCGERDAGQFFLAADFDGDAPEDGDLDADLDGDFDADSDGDAPAVAGELFPEPSPLAAETDPTTS